MSVEGGTPKRLTYHSASDNIASWQGNNTILFSTGREFKNVERGLEVYAVNASGGTEKRVLDAVCLDPSTSPDGRFMAIVKGESNPMPDWIGKGTDQQLKVAVETLIRDIKGRL